MASFSLETPLTLAPIETVTPQYAKGKASARGV